MDPTDTAMGICGYAKKDIGSDSIISKVPNDLCITTSLSRSCILQYLGVSCSEDDFTEKEWIILYLFLHKLVLLQGEEDREHIEKKRKLDVHSEAYIASCFKHAQYMELLPKEIHTPLHFTQKEIHCLKSTPLFNHALKRRFETRLAFWKALKWLERVSKGSEQTSVSIMIDKEFPRWQEYDAMTKFDQMEELSTWGKDEETSSLLSIWRWAESIHGR